MLKQSNQTDQVDPNDYHGTEAFLVSLDSKTLADKLLIVAILVVMLPVYLFSLVLLIKRRDFQPLKSRSVSLIYTSTLGNFLFFLFTMLNLIVSNNIWKMWVGLDQPNKSTSLEVAIWMSCEFT
jgi:hypothetical protein